MAEQRFVTCYRVSTDRQGRFGLGMNAQREAVSQFPAARPATVIAEFVEGGSKDNRPKLRKALVPCQRGKATLLIAKLDRLARSVAFVARLMDGDTEFTAVDMPHASQFVLHIMAAVAEHERQIVGEQTKTALAAAKLGAPSWRVHGTVLAQQHMAGAACRQTTLAIQAAQAWITDDPPDRSQPQQCRLLSRQGGRWHPASVSRVLKRLDLEQKSRG